MKALIIEDKEYIRKGLLNLLQLIDTDIEVARRVQGVDIIVGGGQNHFHYSGEYMCLNGREFQQINREWSSYLVFETIHFFSPFLSSSPLLLRAYLGKQVTYKVNESQMYI